MFTLYMEVVNSSQSVGFTKCRVIPSIYWMTPVSTIFPTLGQLAGKILVLLCISPYFSMIYLLLVIFSLIFINM